MARKLAANVYVGEDLYRAGTSPAKEIADQITNPKAWAGGASESEDSGDAGEKPMSKWTKDELVAEVEKRNVDREDDAKLPATGTKAELLAALEADDASE